MIPSATENKRNPHPENRLKASKGLGPKMRGLGPSAAHLSVVAAEQAVVSGSHASTLTMTIATTFCGTVAAHKAEVAAAVVRLHT